MTHTLTQELITSASSHDQAHLQELQSLLDEAVKAGLRGRSEVVILDVPTHQNAGDLLILHGTLEVLKRLGVRVRYMQDIVFTSWEELARLPRRVGVVLHGGGNLGGLYPQHDAYRARVLATVPTTEQVLLMPQSVSFPDASAAAKARAYYQHAGEATFLIRDSRSLGLLQSAIPEIASATRHCPDAAFGAAPEPDVQPRHDIYVLQRGDKESTRLSLATAMAGLDFAAGDWPTFGRGNVGYRALGRFHRLASKSDGAARRMPSSMRLAARRGVHGILRQPQRLLLTAHTHDQVSHAYRTVSQGRVLVTDRLHGHVAATLLGVPNVALNNADGKVQALIQDWTHGLSTTHFAQTEQQARSLALEALPERPG